MNVMHPPTVVVMLAVNLILCGGLIYLIGRQMPRGIGLRQWGASAILFGCAYVGRLVVGFEATTSWSVLFDSTMVAAAVLFIVGLRNFLGRACPKRPLMIGAMVTFAAVDIVITHSVGAIGRHLLLNVTLSALYAIWVVLIAREIPAQPKGRGPLLMLTLLFGGLALLTPVRVYMIATDGMAAILGGTFAKIYYTYASIAAVLMGLSGLWVVFSRLTTDLSELAARDPLTRTLNRNGLDEVLARHFAARDKSPLVLLQVDLDHFKRFNDTWGHATGDAVLRAVADQMAAHIRGNDFVARIGGEEFLVGCAGDGSTAMVLAERLRNEIESLAIAAPDGSALRCTVSIGVSEPIYDLDAWQTAAKVADTALYAAKAAGRNCVMR